MGGSKKARRGATSSCVASLEVDTLESEEQQKEGQVIINNLCSYIRSSFPLAEKREVLEKDHTTDGYDGDFTLDRAQLCEEQDVRRAIFEEMS